MELTLTEAEERAFWREVQHAFGCEELTEIAAERQLWDVTVNDGLAQEPW